MKRSQASHFPSASMPSSVSRILSVLVTCLAVATGPGAQAASSPPDRMPYQGNLVDGNGAALGTPNPANYQVNFRIWDEATGGNNLWSEQQTVTVDNGLFSVTLGEGTTPGGEPGPAISSIFAGGTADKRFLEMTVNIGGTPLTLAPRLRLLPAPYAFLASQASQIVNSSGTPILNSTAGALSVPGASSFGGRLSLGSSLGNTKLAVWDGDGGANSYGFGVSSGDFRFHVNNSGSTFSFRGTQTGDPIMTLRGDGQLSLRYNLADTKLAIWGENANSYGIGIRANDLRFHLDGTGNNRFSFLAAPGSATPLMAINGNGTIGVFGSNGIEFGAGVPGKDGSAGQIGYGRFTAGALDIVGAGTSGSNRRIKFWAEGGSYTAGRIETDKDVVLRDNVYIYNNGSAINLGYGVPGKETSAGQIAYRRWSQALDIIGASDDDGQNRKIKLWGEGGTFTTGSLGVGTDSPRAALEVAFTRDINVGGFVFYARNASGLTTVGSAGGPTGTINVSVLANGRMVASEFNAISDVRTKDVIGASDSQADLEVIRRLQVTDYTMVDKATEGTLVRKGFIAQEVEKVIPEAVTKSTRVVPDIYALPTKVGFDAATRQLAITLPLEAKVQPGDRVQILADTNMVVKTVVSVRSATEFVLGGCDREPKQLFVYGKEVSDFRTLNYDRIFTTGISAIQALHRQVENQAVELKSMKAQATRIQSLEEKAARAGELEREVSDLKKQVAAYQETQARWEARFKVLEEVLASGPGAEANRVLPVKATVGRVDR